MNKDEALKIAKELKEHNDDKLYFEADILMQKAANCIEWLCKEALKQSTKINDEIGEAEVKQMLNDIEYYQNKEWQGLTEKDIVQCMEKSRWNHIDYCPDHGDFAKHIEQKLKEKNYEQKT